MELERFKDTQHTHCERVVQTLKKKWFPGVLDIFRGVAEDDMLPSLLSGATTLMFKQLRALFTSSIDALVEFFERFAQELRPEGVDPTDHLHSENVSHRALFVVKMVVEAEGYKFSPSVPTMLKTILGTVDHFAAMLNTIPRLDAELGKSASAPRFMTIAAPDDDIILSAKQRLQMVIEANYEVTDAMMQVYSPYAYLLASETDKKINDFNQETRPLSEVTSEIAKFDKARKEVEKRSLPEVRFNLLSVACGAVQQRLTQRANEMCEKLRQAVKSAFLSKASELCSRYMDIFVRLGQHPNTEEEMVALETFLSDCTGLLATLLGELNEARKTLKFLVEQAIGFEAEHLTSIGDTWCWPSKIKPKVDECNKRLKAERNRAEDELNMKKERFIEELDEYVRQAEAFATYGEIGRVSENCLALNTLQSKTSEARERAEFINGEEELLGQPKTVFEQLTAVPQIMAPYLALWMNTHEFTKNSYVWLNGPMSAVDPETLESDVGNLRREAIKSVKNFEADDTGELRAPLKVAEDLRANIEEFKEKLPLISCLCNKGMRGRHWEEVSGIIGYSFKPNETTTLSATLAMGLEKHMERLEEIAGCASKEYSLEKALDKMFSEWQPLEFMLKEYRDTGTCIMAGNEDVQALLDDHIVKSQTMLGSPFIKPFEDRARSWAKKLVLIQDLIDIWLKVQSVWQYLEPIFGSEDIMRQMPEEGKLFKQQDGMWRDNVKKVLRDVKVLVVADIPGLVESYREQHELLERVQKGLNDYLEMKRLYFPRFFFLSNDELLEILSETKDPTRVQPHLGKCFDGIGKLVFEEGNVISGMYSAEGEKVTFGGETITPTAMVEQWLTQVEDHMFRSMARVSDESLTAYYKTERNTWVTQWQGQVIILVGQMDWTASIDKALEDPERGNANLKEYHQKVIKDVEGIVEIVRGKLPKLTRKAVSPLIVIDVHARDVVGELHRGGVSGQNDFDWLAQLRYYPNAEEGNQVKMISTTLPYGNEYLGLQGRLVVTPLTDRCYRTLMGALQLDLGGAPEGPAGTGKTETTKDLGKGTRQMIEL